MSNSQSSTPKPKPHSEPVHEELYDHAHAGSETPPKRVICVAVDSSSHSEYAFNYCLDNIAKKDDQVVLLNCRPVPNYPVAFGISPYGDVSEWIDKVEEDAKAESHSLLKQFGATVLKKGIPCRAIALRGDPRDELVSKVNELGASLLVIGARGLGTFQRAVLGSVSDYAVHHANCAVLVSKKPTANV
ncbi:hypothetical protein HK098_007150 [Nowakowskiella sp. JEL0407]|nr:hypothetical protein HK098_007150 [Nowakowskiella sp. JEL0407]